MLVHSKYSSIGWRRKRLWREERGMAVQFYWLWFLCVASEFWLANLLLSHRNFALWIKYWKEVLQKSFWG